MHGATIKMKHWTLKNVWYLVNVICSSSSSRMQKPQLKPRKYNNFVSIIWTHAKPSIYVVCFKKNGTRPSQQEHLNEVPGFVQKNLKKKRGFFYILVSYCDNDGAMKGKLKHIFDFWTDNVHPIRYHQWRYRYSVPLPSVTIRHCVAGYLLLGHSFQWEEKGYKSYLSRKAIIKFVNIGMGL